VIESREKSGKSSLNERWTALKHFHAVRKDWRILGETAWRKEWRDASRRGFNGCVTGILRLVSSERCGSVQYNTAGFGTVNPDPATVPFLDSCGVCWRLLIDVILLRRSAALCLCSLM